MYVYIYIYIYIYIYHISNNEIRIIKHSIKSLSFHNTEAWKKKPESCFDITKASHDGTKVCKLVGIYIVSNLWWKMLPIKKKEKKSK